MYLYLPLLTVQQAARHAIAHGFGQCTVTMSVHGGKSAGWWLAPDAGGYLVDCLV